MAAMRAPKIAVPRPMEAIIEGGAMGLAGMLEGMAGIVVVKAETIPRTMNKAIRPAVRSIEEGFCIMTGVYSRHRMTARTFFAWD